MKLTICNSVIISLLLSHPGLLSAATVEHNSDSAKNDYSSSSITDSSYLFKGKGPYYFQKKITASNSSFKTEGTGPLYFKKGLNASNSSSFEAGTGSIHISNGTEADNSEFRTTAAPIYFDGKTKMTNSTVHAANGDSTLITFKDTLEASNCQFTSDDTYGLVFKKDVTLNGGNSFTTKGQMAFESNIKAAGDNTFTGGIKMTTGKEFIVSSGIQTFTRTNDTSSQVLTFANIGFAENADESAQININVTEGTGAINFLGNAEVTNFAFTADTCTISLRASSSLTVRDTMSISNGSKLTFGEAAVLTLEVDDISEFTNHELMLDLSNGASLGENANVQLLFTENALSQLSDGMTLDLSNVTNAANITLSLVAESELESAKEIFGTDSIQTGAAGSNGIKITIGAVPEPTTITLSLMALASLATRRRRNC